MKHFIIAFSVAAVFAVLTDSASAADFFRNPRAYSNTSCGKFVLNDKLVQSHDAMMDPCVGSFDGWFGGGFGGMFMPRGRFVGHGGRYGGGSSMQQGYPYYTYRGPRDFLNPNPPSIGY